MAPAAPASVPAVPAWRHAVGLRFPSVVFGKGEHQPTYRAYLIDGQDRVKSYQSVDADTDAEALQAARQFANGCDVEVWYLDRKIGRLERAQK